MGQHRKGSNSSSNSNNNNNMNSNSNNNNHKNGSGSSVLHQGGPPPPLLPGPAVMAQSPQIQNNKVPNSASNSNHNNISSNSNGVVTDFSANCQCHKILNPYPVNGAPQASPSNPYLQHYCRVCNIQLNSCRQSKIHTEGKKHSKRLNYLKLCIESSKTDFNNPSASNSAPSQGQLPPSGAEVLPTGFPIFSTYPTFHHFTPCQTTAPFYYPAHAPHGFALPPPPPTHTLPPSTAQMPQVPPPPPPSLHYPAYAPPNGGANHYQDYYHPPQTHSQLYHTAPVSQGTPPSGYMNAAQQQQSMMASASIAAAHQQQHNVMSPSLTSGFSGSGGDCKSTETSSILSAASYSSSNVNKGHPHGYNTLPLPSRGSKSLSSPPYFCEVCYLAFPNQAILDSHLVSNRHSRRAKSMNLAGSRQQYQSGGGVNSASGVCHNSDDLVKSSSTCESMANSGEIRCEVCQVSVNSSNQLQAHLLGQKHRVRAVRRGLKPNQPVVSPSSSTMTSASTSENSYPVLHLRRGSDVNLIRPVQPQAPGGGGGGGGPASTRHRSLTMCGSVIRSHPMSRHLSSSCLASKAGKAKHSSYSRSTSSLRKAVSYSTLSKSRSMNLLVMSRNSLQQQHWSNDSGAEDDASDTSSDEGGQEEVEEEEEEEEEERATMNNNNNNNSKISRRHLSGGEGKRKKEKDSGLTYQRLNKLPPQAVAESVSAVLDVSKPTAAVPLTTAAQQQQQSKQQPCNQCASNNSNNSVNNNNNNYSNSLHKPKNDLASKQQQQHIKHQGLPTSATATATVESGATPATTSKSKGSNKQQQQQQQLPQATQRHGLRWKTSNNNNNNNSNCNSNKSESSSNSNRSSTSSSSSSFKEIPMLNMFLQRLNQHSSSSSAASATATATNSAAARSPSSGPNSTAGGGTSKRRLEEKN